MTHARYAALSARVRYLVRYGAMLRGRATREQAVAAREELHVALSRMTPVAIHRKSL